MNPTAISVEQREATIDEILEESFPASDPPPWTTGLDVRHPAVAKPASDGAPPSPPRPVERKR